MATSSVRWSGQVALIVAGVELRRRWKGLLVLALVTAVWAGAMLTAATGARRTASALARFVRTTEASDANFSIEEDRDGEELLAALRARSDVVAADSVWAATTDLAHTDRGVWVMVLAGTTGSWGRDFDRPIVLSGRAADPDAEDEVMVTSRTAKLLGIGPGDRFSIPTWDRDVLYAWLEERGAYPAFDGPLIEVTVAGVVRISHDLQATQEVEMIVATPAFVRRWSGFVGDEVRSIVASLRSDVAGPEAIAGELSATLGRSVGVTTREDAFASQVSGATRALATGLWILAAAVLLAGGVLVAIGYTRELRHATDRYGPLVALGATSSQAALVVALPIIATAVTGVVVAIPAATFSSRWFPIGPGRLADPFMTAHLDWMAVAAVTAAVVLVVAFAVRIGTQPVHTAHTRPARLSWPVRSLDHVGAAQMVARSNSFGTRSRRAAPLAAALIIAGLVATTSFATSLRDLGSDPPRWGYTWSSSPESGFRWGDVESALDDTIATPGVAGISQHFYGTAFIEDSPVNVSWFESLRGLDIGLRVLAGERPIAADEVALGEQTARRVNAQIGDVVQIRTAGSAPAAFRVVGLVVPPLQPGATSAGEGAFLTERGASVAFPNGAAGARLLLDYVSGSDRQRLEAALAARPGWVFDSRAQARPPGDVANMLDVSVIIRWLGAFFVVSGVAAVIIAATRRSPRRVHDLGILRALGFTNRDVRALVTTEALIVAVGGLILGTLIGLALGALAWHFAVGRLGVDDMRAPVLSAWLTTSAFVTGATVLMCVVAVRRSRRVAAAGVLREG